MTVVILVYLRVYTNIYLRSEDSESGLLSRGPADSSASSGRLFQIHIITGHIFLFSVHELPSTPLARPIPDRIPCI